MHRPPRRGRTSLAAALAAAPLLLACHAPSVPATPPVASLAFTNATVIDVAGGASLRQMTVVVTGRRIVAVGTTAGTRLPVGTRVVDATGKYLIPGLWDMHVHLFNNAARAGTDNTHWYFPLFVANGVTGVRDMWTDADDLATVRRWMAEMQRGSTIGPRIAAGSSIVDGEPTFAPNALTVTTPEDARRAVRALHSAGAGFIKVYWSLSPAAYRAIAEEATRLGLPFAGHVPFAVSAATASDAGQRSIEHLTGLLETCSAREDELRAAEYSPAVADALWQSYDERKCEALFARFARNGTWHTPTAVMHRALMFGADAHVANDARLRHVPAADAARWRASPPDGGPPLDRATRDARFGMLLETIGAMSRAGVPLLTGTDLGMPFVLPGFSVHDELALFVQAGLTPMDALRTATLNPARYLDATDSLGTITAGKLADLVLLDADPLADIGNTRRIAGVVHDGHYLDRRALHAMLAGAAAARPPGGGPPPLPTPPRSAPGTAIRAP